jgi:hypothetical protein
LGGRDFAFPIADFLLNGSLAKDKIECLLMVDKIATHSDRDKLASVIAFVNKALSKLETQTTVPIMTGHAKAEPAPGPSLSQLKISLNLSMPQVGLNLSEISSAVRLTSARADVNLQGAK